MTKKEIKSKGWKKNNLKRPESKNKFKSKFKDIKNERDPSKAPINANDFSINWKTFLENRKEELPKSKPIKNKSSISNQSKKSTSKNSPKSKQSKSKLESFHKKKHYPKDEMNKSTKGEPLIWFDDVDPKLLEKECGVRSSTKYDAVKSNGEGSTSETKADDKEINITRYVALDCEMVGIGTDGKENALARVSLVNSLGDCIYDKFVKPIEEIVDYRTEVSGVRPSDLEHGITYEVAQKEVSGILKGRILVGHALHNDLKVLLLSHSRRQIRDTAKYKPFKKLLKTKRPALRKLAAEILQKQIQSGEHSSVIDARVTMEIFQKYKKEWEQSLRTPKSESKVADKKVIFMGKGEESKKRKVNKWNKIRQRNKSKQ